MSKKPLPQYSTPDYTKTLPISNKVVKFRPYNVADERLLATAATAKDNDASFYIDNTLKVINRTILNDIPVNTLPAIDVKFLLLHLRAKSVGEIIELDYDGKQIAINIEEIYIKDKREKDDYKIDLGNGLGILMRDLSFEAEIKAASLVSESQSEAIFKILLDSIAAIYNAEDIWNVGEDITVDDVEDFIGNIPSTESKKLYQFLADSPCLAVKLENGQELTSKEVDFLS